jgi:hypothetical protein
MPPPNVEEKRLLEASEACRAEELAVSDQIKHPGHSMLFPEAKRLADLLKVIKLKCAGRICALREYRKKVRDRWC